MSILLLCLSTFGFISFLSQQEELDRYKAPFVFCCTVGLILFLFSLIDLLFLGLVFTVSLGGLLAIFQILKLGRHFKKIKISYSDLLIVLPFIIFYFAIARDFKFLLWDEFSFWASSSKIIYETNSLFKADSPIFLKSYPPIQQLFQYYFVKQTFWSEKNVLYAQIFWVLSSVLCLVGSIVKRPVNIAFTFLFSATFLYFFNYSYSTIYSDPLLGVCFAACLALAFDQHKKITTKILIFISIASLVLIKEIAVLLALVVVGVFFVNTVRQNESLGISLKNRLLSAVITSLLGLLSIFLILKSWAWYVAKIGATRDIVLPNLTALIDPASNKRFSLTVGEFLIRLLKPGFLSVSDHWLNNGPSILVVFILFAVSSLIILLINPRFERIKLSFTLLLVATGAVGYLFALLFTYLVFFTEYEGIRLASFERYLSSYMLAWLLLLFALFCSALDKVKTKLIVVTQLIVGLFIFLFVPNVFFKDIRLIESGGEAYQLRQKTEALADNVKQFIQLNEKVYFVAQNSNGLERTMFYYAMLPYTSSMSWCWSIGKKYYEGDVWTCDVNLTSLLDGYEYLAIYRGDESLWQSGGDLFNKEEILNASPSVFKINRMDGRIESFKRLK